MRIGQAAELLGASDDTVRLWIDNGALSASQDDTGRNVIAGDVLAELWRKSARPLPPNPTPSVSLMSTDAARQLKLEPGSLAVALVRATTVIVETPRPFAD